MGPKYSAKRRRSEGVNLRAVGHAHKAAQEKTCRQLEDTVKWLISSRPGETYVIIICI